MILSQASAGGMHVCGFSNENSIAVLLRFEVLCILDYLGIIMMHWLAEGQMPDGEASAAECFKLYSKKECVYVVV